MMRSVKKKKNVWVDPLIPPLYGCRWDHHEPVAMRYSFTGHFGISRGSRHTTIVIMISVTCCHRMVPNYFLLVPKPRHVFVYNGLCFIPLARFGVQFWKKMKPARVIFLPWATRSTGLSRQPGIHSTGGTYSLVNRVEFMQTIVIARIGNGQYPPPPSSPSNITRLLSGAHRQIIIPKSYHTWHTKLRVFYLWRGVDMQRSKSRAVFGVVVTPPTCRMCIIIWSPGMPKASWRQNLVGIATQGWWLVDSVSLLKCSLPSIEGWYGICCHACFEILEKVDRPDGLKRSKNIGWLFQNIRKINFCWREEPFWRNVVDIFIRTCFGRSFVKSYQSIKTLFTVLIIYSSRI